MKWIVLAGMLIAQSPQTRPASQPESPPPEIQAYIDTYVRTIAEQVNAIDGQLPADRERLAAAVAGRVIGKRLSPLEEYQENGGKITYRFGSQKRKDEVIRELSAEVAQLEQRRRSLISADIQPGRVTWGELKNDTLCVIDFEMSTYRTVRLSVDHVINDSSVEVTPHRYTTGTTRLEHTEGIPFIISGVDTSELIDDRQYAVDDILPKDSVVFVTTKRNEYDTKRRHIVVVDFDANRHFIEAARQEQLAKIHAP